jgi:hypothetical protein
LPPAGRVAHPRAAQHGAHARVQLVQRERLDQVVVRPGVEPADPLLHGVARADDEDGPVRRAPHLRADLEAVDARQPEVEQDDLRVPRAVRAQRPRAVALHAHVVTGVRELEGHRIGQVRVVLDDQDPRSVHGQPGRR